MADQSIRSDSGLRRELGVASAVAAVAGECIAVGIFLTPAAMAKALGSPFWLLCVWVTLGILTISGAVTYGELAARFPWDGGVYIYLLETWGRQIAFLYGWMCLMVLDPGITPALGIGLASYVAYIFPSSPIFIRILAIFFIAGLCLINLSSVRVSAGLMRWTTWLKVAVLATLVVWAVTFRLGSWSNFVPFVSQRPGSLPLGAGLSAAMVAAFFSFGGWWEVSRLAGEVRDAGRTLPRAMLLGVLIVTATYILVSAVFLYLVPLEKVSSDETFVAQAGAVLFGAAGAKALSAIVAVSVLSSMAAVTMSAPRVYYAMAQDGLFLAPVARIHRRFGTPTNAILIQALVASVLVILGSFQQIISYFIFTAVVFLALAGAGLFIARRQPGQTPSFLTPMYPVPPVLFLLLLTLLLVVLALHRPREALLGTAMVLSGDPVYSALLRRGTIPSGRRLPGKLKSRNKV